MSVNAEILLGDVKGYLDISWEMTNDEENKLLGMIERGMNTLEEKIGDCNFAEETQEKSLLLNYVMYDRAGALSDFWQHYRGELLSLRLGNKVREYGEKQAVPDV